MMLVHADGVEAHLGRVLELIHEIVVHVMRPAWVEQRRMDVDPHRGMLLVEVVGKLRVRHQVKPHELHSRPPWTRTASGKRPFTAVNLPSPVDERNLWPRAYRATLLFFPALIRSRSCFVRCNLA